MQGQDLYHNELDLQTDTSQVQNKTTIIENMQYIFFMYIYRAEECIQTPCNKTKKRMWRNDMLNKYSVYIVQCHIGHVDRLECMVT